ncbi:SRPBCC family protein [Reinekea blandensis]|uniref:GyrI-like small molecule binding domain-containing protein n=1 Tax=Reinekea blandensis MED297 TaxID=314283 RepID=A4BBP2_9GAMM|nr:SRPBCC family protein [Reinekea blandensis]EAR10377.1 hypothetical protein MED297_01110 [Reinekea sp. MED297] [Reinekea blandensis MED297]
MPAYNVERSIEIERPAQEVIDYLSDFRHWPIWSPWLIMEPDCEVTYQGTPGEVGAGYHWSGKLVGEGRMTLASRSDSELRIPLEFIRPFRSNAQADFHILPLNGRTQVTWTLSAKLPFFLFFLKATMEQSLGMDYERGLRMLKSQLETGSIPSQMTLIGRRSQPSMVYLALRGEAPAAELSSLIPAQFEQLHEYCQQHDIQVTGAPFTLYEYMDMKTSVNSVRNAFPIAERVAVTEPFICSELDACETYVVSHRGAYPFVGNAWAMAFFAARHFKVKLAKQPVGFEHYLSDPQTVPAEQLETEIVLIAR